MYFQNGKPLISADFNKNMYLKNNNEILVLLNNISNEKEIYECEAENYYHKFYSVYTLNVEGMIIKKILILIQFLNIVSPTQIFTMRINV